MLNLITVDKEMIVNGVAYKNAQEALSALMNHTGGVEILINCKNVTASHKAPVAPEAKEADFIDIIKVEVRQYMTQKGSPEFDFMTKYNNDVPMPMRRMYGEVLEETKGMVKMKLHGRAEKDSSNCAHCMRTLTHPVSMFYGVGPICGEHFHMAPMHVLEKIKDQEELFKIADEKLRATEWTGWIIKKAILSFNVVEQVKIEKKGA